MTDPQQEPGEPVGSLTEEAVKLLGVLGDWARDQGGDLGAGAAAAARQVDDHVATGGEECRWCPVCRTVHAIRQTNPEVREQLVVAATALLQAGTSILTALQSQQPGSAPGQHRAGRQAGIEHIDLTDEVGPDDDKWEN